jgi:hypothetical protein
MKEGKYIGIFLQLKHEGHKTVQAFIFTTSKDIRNIWFFLTISYIHIAHISGQP